MGKWLCCLVIVSLVVAASGMCLANGGAKEEVKQEAVKEAPAAQTGVKSPGVATLLSFLVPGAGQAYNGDGLKAIIMCGGEVCSWFLVGNNELENIGLVGLLIGRVLSPVDAYYSALEKNKGLSLMLDNKGILVALKTNF